MPQSARSVCGTLSWKHLSTCTAISSRSFTTNKHWTRPMWHQTAKHLSPFVTTSTCIVHLRHAVPGLETSSTPIVSRLRCSTDSPVTPGRPTMAFLRDVSSISSSTCAREHDPDCRMDSWRLKSLGKASFWHKLKQKCCSCLSMHACIVNVALRVSFQTKKISVTLQQHRIRRRSCNSGVIEPGRTHMRRQEDAGSLSSPRKREAERLMSMKSVHMQGLPRPQTPRAAPH